MLTKMEAELLKFTGFFEKSDHLKNFSCPNCHQPISEQDISRKNYQLWVSDYANDLNKEECPDSPYYSLSFWLKAVEHEYCPDTETCESCYKRFLTENMKEFESNYYCLSCYTAKEVKHE